MRSVWAGSAHSPGSGNCFLRPLAGAGAPAGRSSTRPRFSVFLAGASGLAAGGGSGVRFGRAFGRGCRPSFARERRFHLIT